ncbi:MAG TPA: hypothetical protein VIB47_07395 [Dehalococcoidia bacterium]|jgi:hypothetical protein
MTNNDTAQRQSYLSRITEKQREATELSIQLKLDAEESEDVSVLAEATRTLEDAVREIERARRVLVAAR